MKKIKNMHIDIVGPYSGNTGWATHAQHFARAMNKILPVNYRASISRRELFCKDLPMLWRGLRNPPGQFGIVVEGTPFPEQKSARWIVWETTVLPDSIQEQCTTSEYLWTPSYWGKNILISNGIEPNRISIVPEGVDTEFFKPIRKNTNRPFRFLFVGKWETRKCPEKLIHAFSKEFKTHENVELVLHAHNSLLPNFSQKKELEKLKVSNEKKIIISEKKSKNDLLKLYQSADCFVMPTRAEGWGLPILESMACGVPAIVTAYSAPMDFLNKNNSYLLNIECMIDADCDLFNIKSGQWAEPDTSHLRHLMRSAFENPQKNQQKGSFARQSAVNLSWDNAAKIAYKTIKSYPLP